MLSGTARIACASNGFGSCKIASEPFISSCDWCVKIKPATVKYWEIVADNLHDAGWSLAGCQLWMLRGERTATYPENVYLILICETFETIISGLPWDNVILPDTATVLPSYCCGFGKSWAMLDGIKAVKI